MKKKTREINGRNGEVIEGLEWINPKHADWGVNYDICDLVLFSLYPHRYFAPTATNILQRGNPCCVCLESPRAQLTWIREEKRGEGDDGKGDKEMWGEVGASKGCSGMEGIRGDRGEGFGRRMGESLYRR